MNDRAPVIGFAGLATSHPYTDSRSLRAVRPDVVLHVWEDDGLRRSQFLELNPDAIVHETLESLTESPLDGAVVSVKPPVVADVAAMLSALQVPLFINKPAAAVRDHIDRLDPVLEPVENLVFSASVLRFAPSVTEFRHSLRDATVLSAQVTVRHDVGRWLDGGTPWQDDPEIGGGAIVTLAIHGVELLFSLLGAEASVVFAASNIRHLHGLQSEDNAIINVRWDDGLLGAVQMLGVAAHETYDIVVETTEGPRRLQLPAGSEDPYGYRSTIEAFLSMVHDHVAGLPVQSPVPWPETRTILRAVTDAARLAR